MNDSHATVVTKYMYFAKITILFLQCVNGFSKPTTITITVKLYVATSKQEVARIVLLLQI